MKPQNHAATLTRRDLKMFLSLGHFGMLSTSQIEHKIYLGVQNSTVLRRLRRLEKDGWIYRIRALESGELVWLLTRKGEETVQVEAPMIRPNRNGIAHDVGLSALRMRLESIGLGENFIPDWSMRRQTFTLSRRRRDDHQIVPDGIFSARLRNKSSVTVALELEINAKTTQRYERIFHKYLGRKNLGFIWYFVKTESFAEALIAKWNRVEERRLHVGEHSAGLIVTVLSEFEVNPRKALLRFSDGDTRRVEDVFHLTDIALPQNKTAQAVGRGAAKNSETEITEIAS